MLRLGVTGDVDLAPLFFPLEAGWAATPSGLVTSVGTLAELEARLLAAELDIAPISPLTYAQHQTRLYLLPYPVRAFDLASDALFLISNKRLDKYDKPKVAVAPSSATGQAILSLIERNFYSFEAQYQRVPSEVSALTALQNGADICILSGETGMRAVGPAKGKGYFVEDLSKAWWLSFELSLPLVMFGVRREWTEQEPEAIALTRATIQMFRSAVQHAKEQMPTLTEQAEKRTNLPAPVLTDHYAAQRYELNQNHLRGLLEFYRRATALRLISPVDDLEFFPPLGVTAPGPASPPRRIAPERPSLRRASENGGDEGDENESDDHASPEPPTTPRSRPSSPAAQRRATAQGLRVIKGGKDPEPDALEEEVPD